MLAVASYIEKFKEGLRPEERLSVDTWADKNRILSSKASAEPGKYRTERTPFLREIMQCLSADDPTEEIVFMKASQVGSTECGNNWVGYIIDHCPAPTLLIQPTVELAKRNSKTRIDPLIEECPRLSSKVKDRRSRDSSNTVLAKEFPGGILIMTGANSAVGLRSAPCRFIFGDEIDAYPMDANNEGSPIQLAKARARTFTKRKFFWTSTPTIEGRSEISNRFEMSDKRFHHVPCPHCGEYQKLIFTQLKFERDDEKKLIRKSVHYECEHCQGKIKNWQKTKMLKRGMWIKENPKSRIAGFHLNGLYSPVGWLSWEDICQEFLDSKSDTNKLRAFVNTVLGETWKEKSEVPDYHRLYERRDFYPINIVPSGGVFLSCGVDVQSDRLEAEIVAWGRDKISWSVDYRILSGDTSTDKPWDALERMLAETWPRENNEKNRIPIKIMAIDSGYNTQTVYNWARRFSPNRVIAVKGVEGKQSIISVPSPVDVTVKGKKFKRGLKIWTVGTDLAKSELYGWLRQDAATGDGPDPIGYCHFPEYDVDYFKQLTAEELTVRVNKNGFRVYEFVKVRERNEALDCRVYARAAAAIIGMDRFQEKHWAALEGEREVSIKDVHAAKPIDDKPTNKTSKRRRRSSSWL